jgi:hypothetical protein
MPKKSRSDVKVTIDVPGVTQRTPLAQLTVGQYVELSIQLSQHLNHECCYF